MRAAAQEVIGQRQEAMEPLLETQANRQGLENAPVTLKARVFKHDRPSKPCKVVTSRLAMEGRAGPGARPAEPS